MPPTVDTPERISVGQMKARGLTNFEFGELCECHFTMASYLRGGQRKPSPTLFGRIVTALELDEDKARDAYFAGTFGEFLTEEVFGGKPKGKHIVPVPPAPVKERQVPHQFDGQKMRAERMGAKISRVKLSRETGIPESTLYGYENGTRVPNSAAVQLIADALILLPADIMTPV